MAPAPDGRKFVVLPEPKAPSPFAAAVVKVLEGESWVPSRTEWHAADLVIVDHQDPAYHVEPADLEFYKLPAPGKTTCRRVLYLSPLDTMFPSARRAGYHWLFALTQSYLDVAALCAWLKESRPDLARSVAERPLYDPRRCREDLGQRFGTERSFTPWLAGLLGLPEESEVLADHPVLKWFDGDDPGHFYYALLCLCGNRHRYHHDARNDFEERRGKGENASLYLAIEDFLEALEDLRRSMNSILHVHDEQKRILVVDDHPTQLEVQLGRIRDWVAPYEFSLWELRPTRASCAENEPSLDALCGYQSVAASSTTWRIPVRSLEGKESAPSLAELLTSTRFILVDQLYEESSARHSIRGPDVIRGLRRVIGDTWSSLEAPPRHSPEIIALSRAQAPGVIQRALRAGAADYVLKSNIQRLPAVLARAERIRSGVAGLRQSPFRRLRELPNQVMGLINEVTVPRLQWEREGANRSPSYKETAVRRLLEAVPKTDLHVHVGSCMSPEFLILASLVGLLEEECPSPGLIQLVKHLQLCVGSGSAEIPVWLGREVRVKVVSGEDDDEDGDKDKKDEDGDKKKDWIRQFARSGRVEIKKTLETASTDEKRALRSILHASLDISDYLSDTEALEKLNNVKPDIDVALFLLRQAQVDGTSGAVGIADRAGGRPAGKHAPPSPDTIVRAYLLLLASKTPGTKLTWNGIDLLESFRQPREGRGLWNPKRWMALRALFYDSSRPWSCNELRSRGWRPPATKLRNQPIVSYPERGVNHVATFENSPIEWTLASGTRSESLREYLQGCEFSGSAHLQHPLLLHLYAQHVMHQLVRQGLVYVELRGSPDGYANSKIGFSFADALQCLVEAFSAAQEELVKRYRKAQQVESYVPTDEAEAPNGKRAAAWLPHLFFGGNAGSHKWSLDGLEPCFKRAPASVLDRRYPPMVGLVLVGKRHKTTHQMMLESAAGALLYQPIAREKRLGAGEFLDRLSRSPVVGFDLAGQEAGFPPAQFAAEFRRLARLHVPMTVHAGENASAQFIEDAVLELGARRIGHGLTLVDDKRLMARVREERTCVELCPVSNHQTCRFTPPGEPGRQYPLRKLLDFGIPVCLNTDNPIISDTDIVKEYFQASFAIGPDGLTLLDALRLVKAGLRHAFLPLPERRALIELVEQIVVDLFADPEVVAMLSDLAEMPEPQP